MHGLVLSVVSTDPSVHEALHAFTPSHRSFFVVVKYPLKVLSILYIQSSRIAIMVATIKAEILTQRSSSRQLTISIRAVQMDGKSDEFTRSDYQRNLNKKKSSRAQRISNIVCSNENKSKTRTRSNQFLTSLLWLAQSSWLISYIGRKQRARQAGKWRAGLVILMQAHCCNTRAAKQAARGN